MKFFKMSGSGNDFVIIDNRKNIIEDRKSTAIKLCHRKFGVGADGLMLVEDSQQADFRMRIFNSDGSEAEMCGNGLRCIVRFVSENIYQKDALMVETEAGLLEGFVEQEQNIRVQLNVSGEAKLNIDIPIENVILKGHFINTGVPHTVIVTDDIENIELEKFGPLVRYHKLFAPGGTNVNWIQVIDKQQLKIRTYERGVEAETLSCGTGSVAGALISNLLNKTVSPTSIIARSGEILKISFDEEHKKIYLSGKTQLSFKGEWIGV
ncbi:diaminopimelate epimerase [bacterium]|nr:diaminopimelate epimerase [bacterium]